MNKEIYSFLWPSRFHCNFNALKSFFPITEDIIIKAMHGSIQSSLRDSDSQWWGPGNAYSVWTAWLTCMYEEMKSVEWQAITITYNMCTVIEYIDSFPAFLSILLTVWITLWSWRGWNNIHAEMERTFKIRIQDYHWFKVSPILHTQIVCILFYQAQDIHEYSWMYSNTGVGRPQDDLIVNRKCF